MGIKSKDIHTLKESYFEKTRALNNQFMKGVKWSKLQKQSEALQRLSFELFIRLQGKAH